MNPEDFADFEYPRRRPWLLIGLVVVLAAILAFRFWRGGERIAVPAGTTVDGAAVAAASSESGSGVPVAAKVRPESGPGHNGPAGRCGPSPALREAQALDSAGKLPEAREAYLKAMERPLSEGERVSTEKRLGEIHVALAFSLLPMPEKLDYEVQRGDSVDRIAKKFGTTADLIIIQNNLKSNAFLRVGERLRVLKGTFSIEVSKARNDMILELNGRFFKRYLVGTGKGGKTPVGTFVITAQKEKNPTWWKDNKAIPFGHPENVLGTRWMAIKATGSTPDVKGYGIHGTWEDASIGKAESAGCIRMHNREVEELFTLVPPGTVVTITE